MNFQRGIFGKDVRRKALARSFADAYGYRMILECGNPTKENCSTALEMGRKYRIDVNDLPQMFEKDPVAIAIGAKEGDIVKIIRDSSTTVRSIDYYRFVKKEKV